LGYPTNVISRAIEALLRGESVADAVNSCGAEVQQVWWDYQAYKAAQPRVFFHKGQAYLAAPGRYYIHWSKSWVWRHTVGPLLRYATDTWGCDLEYAGQDVTAVFPFKCAARWALFVAFHGVATYYAFCSARWVYRNCDGPYFQWRNYVRFYDYLRYRIRWFFKGMPLPCRVDAPSQKYVSLPPLPGSFPIFFDCEFGRHSETLQEASVLAAMNRFLHLIGPQSNIRLDSNLRITDAAFLRAMARICLSSWNTMHLETFSVYFSIDTPGDWRTDWDGITTCCYSTTSVSFRFSGRPFRAVFPDLLSISGRYYSVVITATFVEKKSWWFTVDCARYNLLAPVGGRWARESIVPINNTSIQHPELRVTVPPGCNCPDMCLSSTIISTMASLATLTVKSSTVSMQGLNNLRSKARALYAEWVKGFTPPAVLPVPWLPEVINSHLEEAVDASVIVAIDRANQRNLATTAALKMAAVSVAEA
jgi:hypothetical protein